MRPSEATEALAAETVTALALRKACCRRLWDQAAMASISHSPALVTTDLRALAP
jgi:hypothetical protein